MKNLIIIAGKILTICVIACICTDLAEAAESRSADNRKAIPKDGFPYITCSAGTAVWYTSGQAGMVNRAMPLFVGLEYGRTSNPLSIIADAFFNTAFNYDIFLLKPDNLLLGLQFAPLEGGKTSGKLNLYLIAGLNASYSRFTDDHYSGIVNYEYKTERKTGAGLGAGAGVGYRLKSWEIKPVLFYFTGHSYFFAGHFSEQKFNTGSLQLHVTITHRIIFNKNNRTCPVYYKYHRI